MLTLVLQKTNVHYFSTQNFRGIRFAQIFSFLCCVLTFTCLRSVACVHILPVSLDFPFGLLQHLFAEMFINCLSITVCYTNIMGFLWLIEDLFDEYKTNLI